MTGRYGGRAPDVQRARRPAGPDAQRAGRTPQMTPEEQAHALALAGLRPSVEPRRRLSWVRVGGVLLVCGLAAAAVVGVRSGGPRDVKAVPPSSFAPYVDVTATPQFAFEDPTQSAASNVVLGFVVSEPSAACQPSWG